nr:hypothetical protein [Pseudomonadota bacterium]
GTKDAIVRTEPFIYAGGFVAHPTATSTANNVKFSTWTAAFSPRLLPTTALAGGDFVQGTATVLPIGGRASNSIRNRGTLSLTDTLDGAAPTSGTNHGVGFFMTNNHYFAAGILSGTDLGAPLSNIAQAGAWQGRISAFSNRHPTPIIRNKPFTLTVIYDGPGGRISAFMRDDSPFSESNPDPYYYKLDGTYDSKGVIRGTVIAAKFKDGDASATPADRIVPIANSANNLTGLIGERGAVGAFQSYYRNPNNSNAQYGYTGGFVACKRNDADTACK